VLTQFNMEAPQVELFLPVAALRLHQRNAVFVARAVADQVLRDRKRHAGGDAGIVGRARVAKRALRAAERHGVIRAGCREPGIRHRERLVQRF